MDRRRKVNLLTDVKIWILHHTDYGDVYVYDGRMDPFEIPLVKDELSHLDGYEDEVEEFKSDIARAIKRGDGRAEIEERFYLELDDLKLVAPID